MKKKMTVGVVSGDWKTSAMDLRIAANLPTGTLTTLKHGKVLYKLVRGTAWYCGERKAGSTGWVVDNWLGEVNEITEEVAFEMFTQWASEDYRRLQTAENIMLGKK